MIFSNPEYLPYLLILPFGILVYLFRSSWRKRDVKKWLGKQKSLVVNISSFKRHLKISFVILALSFIILSLARPQGLGDKKNVKRSGVQIVLAVDISQSMLAEDIKPNRLSFAKRELSQLIDSLQGNQIALIAFSGSSALISPFTNDLSALKLYLNDLSPDYTSQKGTDFGLLFNKVEEVFKRIRVKKDQSVAKVLIMVSDGEDHSNSVKDKIKKMIKNYIRVFTLSVGTKEGGVIPIKDRAGHVIEYKKDSAQKVVVSRLNPNTLKDFARLTKGAYYELRYGGNTPLNLKKDLDKMEKTVFEQSSMIQKTEHYQWFLFIGLLFALLELMIGERRRATK